MFTCGTNDDTYDSDIFDINTPTVPTAYNQVTTSTEESIDTKEPLVTIRTNPIRGISCNNTTNDRFETYYTNDTSTNTTLYITKKEPTLIQNVLWIALNRICSGILNNFISNPSQCKNNSNMVTWYDSNQTNQTNWSYCLSSNNIIRHEFDSYDNSTTIIPAMMVVDEYNETIVTSSCPYLQEYAPMDAATYAPMAISAISRLWG
jgi:hypothetical protein